MSLCVCCASFAISINILIFLWTHFKTWASISNQNSNTFFYHPFQSTCGNFLFIFYSHSYRLLFCCRPFVGDKNGNNFFLLVCLCFYLIKCYKRPAMNRFPVFDIWIQAKLQRDKFVRFNWMNWLNNWRLLTAIASGLILHRHSMKLVCFNTISCESLKLVKQNVKWQHTAAAAAACAFMQPKCQPVLSIGKTQHTVVCV